MQPDHLAEPSGPPLVSIIIVSFNTRDLLLDCVAHCQAGAGDLAHEIIVVDNASHDGSAAAVAARFPAVRLIESTVNLGFAAANNRGFAVARGHYLVLVNSDAFLPPGQLTRAVAKLEAAPAVGLAGGRLVGRDGSWQPSARMFPSLLNDFLSLSGLAARQAHHRFYGRADRTWADPLQPAVVDWVPGAFALLRRAALDQVGGFDEAFFLYYEEVDLCRRLWAAGWQVHYWPDLEVVHIGGESSRTLQHLDMSAAGKGAQLTLWRLRSCLLYYRKHHGLLGAWGRYQLERQWHRLRAWRNAGPDPLQAAKRAESLGIGAALAQAWRETAGGRVSPSRPW